MSVWSLLQLLSYRMGNRTPKPQPWLEFSHCCTSLKPTCNTADILVICHSRRKWGRFLHSHSAYFQTGELLLYTMLKISLKFIVLILRNIPFAYGVFSIKHKNSSARARREQVSRLGLNLQGSCLEGGKILHLFWIAVCFVPDRTLFKID